MIKNAWMLGVLSLAAAAGCDNDPGKGKPKAEATEAVEVKPAEPAASAVKYAFSQEGSKLEFVGAKITGKHDGGFNTFAGAVDLVDGDVTKGKIEVTIQTDSLFSDNDMLTGHLKNEDFFAVESFPTAGFVSTSIVAGGAEGATHTITGNLTLRGVTKSITFPAKIEVEGDEVEAEAEFVINRKDFNIVYAGKPDDLIKDEVLIKLDIEAKKS